MTLFFALGALWTVLYTAFWVLGIRAGWAWRKTYALTASRHAAHAVLVGYLAALAGFGAMVVGS